MAATQLAWPGASGSALAAGPDATKALVAPLESFGRHDLTVAPFTNPSWTPLFPLAAAVEVDTGGANSHAVVAREYGVPAVIGTRDATARPRDGQRVRGDGTRGLIFAA